MAQRDNIDLQRGPGEAQALALEDRLKATVTERDGYVVDLAQLRLRYQALLLQHQALEAEAGMLRDLATTYPLVQAQLEEALQTSNEQAETIRRIHASPSWRLLAPFRAAAARLQRVLGRRT